MLKVKNDLKILTAYGDVSRSRVVFRESALSFFFFSGVGFMVLRPLLLYYGTIPGW
jgi:hypothetical protein